MNYEKPELLDLSSSVAIGDNCSSVGSIATGSDFYCTAGGSAQTYCSAGTTAIQGACTAGVTATGGSCTSSGNSAQAACTTSGNSAGS